MWVGSTTVEGRLAVAWLALGLGLSEEGLALFGALAAVAAEPSPVATCTIGARPRLGHVKPGRERLARMDVRRNCVTSQPSGPREQQSGRESAVDNRRMAPSPPDWALSRDAKRPVRAAMRLCDHRDCFLRWIQLARHRGSTIDILLTSYTGLWSRWSAIGSRMSDAKSGNLALRLAWAALWQCPICQQLHELQHCPVVSNPDQHQQVHKGRRYQSQKEVYFLNISQAAKSISGLFLTPAVTS